MVGNPYRWKAVIPQLEDRNATAGCCLALLLFVPLLAKTFHISMEVIALFVAIYVSIIVPIGTGIISKKYLIDGFRKLSSIIFDDLVWNFCLTHISYVSSWLYYFYFYVNGVQTFTLQIMFNAACAKVFCPSQRFLNLYAVLFYSFLAYVHQSLKDRPWTRLFCRNSTTNLAQLTTSFAAARLGKGVVVTLALLTFNYKFNDSEANYEFLILSFIYVCLTKWEKSYFVKDILVDWLGWFEIHILDGFEEFWLPVLIPSITTGMSVFVLINLLIYTDRYFLMILLGFLNIFLPFKNSIEPAWEKLKEEKKVIAQFPKPSWNNSRIRERNPCPVCLDKMSFFSARITPCGHLFHGSCLRKCLNYSKQCPLCKSSLS